MLKSPFSFMKSYQATICMACGAPLSNLEEPIITCEYCHASYVAPPPPVPPQEQLPPPRVPLTPDVGDLLLGADFLHQRLDGWRLPNEDKVSFHQEPDYPPEMWVTIPAEKSYFRILETAGVIDDCDFSANIRFLEGKKDEARAAIQFRYGDGGNYLVGISPQGTFCVGYHIERKWGDFLLNWGEHDALREGWGPTNRLRVVNRRNQIQVYLNGKLATSIRDERYPEMGRVTIAIAPMDRQITVAISDVQLRGVRA